MLIYDVTLDAIALLKGEWLSYVSMYQIGNRVNKKKIKRVSTKNKK